MHNPHGMGAWATPLPARACLAPLAVPSRDQLAQCAMGPVEAEDGQGHRLQSHCTHAAPIHDPSSYVVLVQWGAFVSPSIACTFF